MGYDLLCRITGLGGKGEGVVADQAPIGRVTDGHALRHVGEGVVLNDGHGVTLFLTEIDAQAGVALVPTVGDQLSGGIAVGALFA